MDIEAWVKSIFDRPVIDGGWYWKIEQDPAFFKMPPKKVVEHLTRFFTASGTLLQPYSDGQIEWGLWYIAAPGSSDVAHELSNQNVPLDERLACLNAIYHLYADVFAVRCKPLLAHLERGARGTPVNTICYMWWDVFPLWVPPGSPGEQQIHDAMLPLFERVLRLKSIACQESALHGLNHWRGEGRAAIIDAFLARSPRISPELKRYAEICRVGGAQ